MQRLPSRLLATALLSLFAAGLVACSAEPPSAQAEAAAATPEDPHAGVEPSENIPDPSVELSPEDIQGLLPVGHPPTSLDGGPAEAGEAIVQPEMPSDHPDTGPAVFQAAADELPELEPGTLAFASTWRIDVEASIAAQLDGMARMGAEPNEMIKTMLRETFELADIELVLAEGGVASIVADMDKNDFEIPSLEDQGTWIDEGAWATVRLEEFESGDMAAVLIDGVLHLRDNAPDGKPMLSFARVEG